MNIPSQNLLDISYPISIGSKFTLSDNRELGYIEYIHPDDKQLSNLHIIILIPGIPGSRFFTHPSLCNLHGIRLFVLERPGFGLSSPHENSTFISFAHDVQEFVHAMQLISFSVIGYSAGGPFALAIAYLLKSHLKKVAIISSISPHEAPNAYKGMPIIHKLAWFGTVYFPGLLKLLVLQDSKKDIVKVIADYKRDALILPNCDQIVLNNPKVQYLFCISEMEIISRKQLDAISHEYALWGKPWGFELGDIQTDVKIWHGTLDVSTTIGMGRYLANRIGCKLVECQGKGHMLYFDIFESVIEWIKI